MQLQNHPRLKQRRRQLRNRPTTAKHLLWYRLRGSKRDGRKFWRQHSIGPFIADFYYPEEKLVFEIDGNIHDEVFQHRQDRKRTEYLESKGIKVLRFPNGQVMTDQQSILDEIRTMWKGRER